MACLSDDSSSSWFSPVEMFSTHAVLEEEEASNMSGSKSMEYRLEKVFPVYAMGLPNHRDSNPVVSVSNSGSTVGDPIWDAVREEAKFEVSLEQVIPTPQFSYREMEEKIRKNSDVSEAHSCTKQKAEKEPILSSFLYASILAHDCLERALGFVLANRLQNPTLLATQLMDIFCDVIMHDRGIQRSIRLDVQAFKDRDPSCLSYCSALLYLKGYHSVQTYRVAHALWNQGRTVLALALQSRISEVFGVDIHPAAKIGEGILLDHGTGVVIGETAVVGNRVSLMQGVTLGGTGKEIGDRHPKVDQGALIGASATILGNIKIGEGAMIAAGSLVLQDIPPHSMVAGIPAKVIGYVNEQDPSLTMKHDASKEFFEHVADSSTGERSKGTQGPERDDEGN